MVTGYHNQYTSAEFVRGQERDPWFLQLELFDHHEPFISPARFRENLPTNYSGPILDWPIYDQLHITPKESAELRANYLALIAMCDHYIGTVLDKFDEHGLWDNTAIVLTTDHGFLLGEQDWRGKNRMPMRDPVSHIPLLVTHPDLVGPAGSRRDALTQCLDVPATLLDIMRIATPDHYEGRSVLPVIQKNAQVRDHALFGIFGGAMTSMMRDNEAPAELFERFDLA